MDLNARWEKILNTAVSNKNLSVMSRNSCANSLHEIHDLASLYESSGDLEKAYSLYLRFVTMTVQELPNHKDYLQMRVDYPLFDAKIFEAILKLESLKPKLIKLLEEKCPDENTTLNEMSEHAKLESRMRPFIFCHNVSVQPIVFQQFEIYNDLPQVFFKHRDNTYCYGLLYGHLAYNSNATASYLIMVTERNLLFSEYDRMIPDPKQPKASLPVIGCVCTSIVDMIDAGIFARIRMSELVCVICSMGPDGTSKTTSFHLMNMSPSTAFQKSSHLKHESNPHCDCNHLHISDGTTIVLPNSANMSAVTTAEEIPTSASFSNGPKITLNQS